MVKKTISFENAVIKNHNQLKTHLKTLLTIVSNLKLTDKERTDQANAHCMNIIRHCNTLQDILSTEDRPDWLIKLLDSCKKYKNDGFGPNPFNIIYENYPKAINHEWNFSAHLDGIDFDSIYKKFREESELPKLLDELIELLKKLINENGDEIQAKTLADLTKMLNTVVTNKNGSSTAIETSLYLIVEFFKKTFFTLFPAIQITYDGIETIKKIGDVVGRSIAENRMIQDKVFKKTEENFSNSIQYSGNGEIDHKNIVPTKVLEHYIDKSV